MKRACLAAGLFFLVMCTTGRGEESAVHLGKDLSSYTIEQLEDSIKAYDEYAKEETKKKIGISISVSEENFSGIFTELSTYFRNAFTDIEITNSSNDVRYILSVLCVKVERDGWVVSTSFDRYCEWGILVDQDSARYGADWFNSVSSRGKGIDSDLRKYGCMINCGRALLTCDLNGISAIAKSIVNWCNENGLEEDRQMNSSVVQLYENKAKTFKEELNKRRMTESKKK